MTNIQEQRKQLKRELRSSGYYVLGFISLIAILTVSILAVSLSYFFDFSAKHVIAYFSIGFIWLGVFLLEFCAFIIGNIKENNVKEMWLRKQKIELEENK